MVHMLPTVILGRVVCVSITARYFELHTLEPDVGSNSVMSSKIIEE